MLKRLFGRLNSKKQKDEKTRSISPRSREVSNENLRTISFLLLGPGGSGKSTILKQLEKIHRGSIQKRMLQDATIYVKQNILWDIYDLSLQNMSLSNQINEHDLYLSSLISNGYMRIITALTKTYQKKLNSSSFSWVLCMNEHLNIFIPSEIVQIICKYYQYCSFELSEESQIICAKIQSSKGSEQFELTPDLAKEISILWNDKAFQETFNIRTRQCVMDNLPYFLQKIEEISQPEYCADFEDYIRLHRATAGIEETEFDFHCDSNEQYECRFNITDVGGARSERRKWLRCFSDIHAIIYVMSLDGYDKTIYEDHTQNCYHEALYLFDHVMKHEALATINCIVFLNKDDLFLRKIKEVAFTVFDASFNSKLVHNGNAVKDYLCHEYKKRFYNGIKPDKSPRRIFFHVTCAAKTKQIKEIDLIQCAMTRNRPRFGALM